MKFTNISQDIFAAKCNSFPFNQYFNLIINLIPPFWIIEYKPYNYLNLPPHLRLPLARLRSSAHCRMIELGRYTFHPQHPPEEGVCTYCGVTEDEEHFVVYMTVAKGKTSLATVPHLTAASSVCLHEINSSQSCWDKIPDFRFSWPT